MKSRSKKRSFKNSNKNIKEKETLKIGFRSIKIKALKALDYLKAILNNNQQGLLAIIKIIPSILNKSIKQPYMSKSQWVDPLMKAIIPASPPSILKFDSHKKTYNLKLNIFK